MRKTIIQDSSHSSGMKGTEQLNEIIDQMRRIMVRRDNEVEVIKEGVS